MLTTRAIIFLSTRTILLIIVALLALVYSLPILCIRRFQHRNNIFALNVCLTTLLSCLWGVFNCTSPLFGARYWEFLLAHPWLLGTQVLVSVSTVFSFVLVSFHQCCSILCPQKRLFRSKTWTVLCLVSQWLLVSVLCIPGFIDPVQVSFAVAPNSSEIVYRCFTGFKVAMGAILFIHNYGDPPINDRRGL